MQHSVWFTIFGFPIHAYGAMLAISFLTGIWFASYRVKKAGKVSSFYVIGAGYSILRFMGDFIQFYGPGERLW
jgi:prolipoprotein diacylglyceryltransferase